MNSYVSSRESLMPSAGWISCQRPAVDGVLRAPHEAAVVLDHGADARPACLREQLAVTAGGVLSTSKGVLSLSPVSASVSGLEGASLAVTRTR